MNNNIIPVYQPMKDAVKTTGLSVSDSCNLCPICYNGGNNKITTVIRSRSQYWLWREQVEMIGALSHRD